MEEVDDPGDADVGGRLVDDLLHLDGRHAVVESRSEHHPELGHGADRDDGTEPVHRPFGPGEVAGDGPQGLVEGEVVEEGDELRVGAGQI